MARIEGRGVARRGGPSSISVPLIQPAEHRGGTDEARHARGVPQEGREPVRIRCANSCAKRSASALRWGIILMSRPAAGETRMRENTPGRYLTPVTSTAGISRLVFAFLRGPATVASRKREAVAIITS